MKWKSHHLLDFGDSFGSDSDIARNPRCGQEFWPTSRESKRAMTQGLFPASWEQSSFHDAGCLSVNHLNYSEVVSFSRSRYGDDNEDDSKIRLIYGGDGCVVLVGRRDAPR
jgi:hypothetical protein